MIYLVIVPAVFPLSIVKYVPMEEESYTNTIYRKAYNLVPGLKRLRAKSPAEGKDFVSAVVTGLSAEFVGTGVRDEHTWVQNNKTDGIQKPALHHINHLASNISELMT